MNQTYGLTIVWAHMLTARLSIADASSSWALFTDCMIEVVGNTA